MPEEIIKLSLFGLSNIACGSTLQAEAVLKNETLIGHIFILLDKKNTLACEATWALI